jgi:hypothetical protein
MDCIISSNYIIDELLAAKFFTEKNEVHRVDSYGFDASH